VAYWVYENIPTNHATVHDGACGFCNDGRGVKAERIVKENKWHGPFEEEHEAFLFGQGLGRQLTVHTCCPHPIRGTGHRRAPHPSSFPGTEPGTPRSPLPPGRGAPAGTDRFQLDDVDESAFSAEELFHRRMLQIYVTLRDETGYSARRFLTAVRKHGGVGHAKSALARHAATQTGLEKLREMGRLHQTMEWHVLMPEFAGLFTPAERAEARRRLEAAG
jgi:hypothetical protein